MREPKASSLSQGALPCCALNNERGRKKKMLGIHERTLTFVVHLATYVFPFPVGLCIIMKS